MIPLLILSPDSTLHDAHSLAVQAYPHRRVEMLHVPSTDYYHFDLSGLEAFAVVKWDVCIAVNEFYINDIRRAFHALVEALGYRAVSLISPRAHVDASVTVGSNTIIHAGCFVGAGCTIGHHCVLRPNVVLGEEVCIGDYVTLEANVSIREKSKIGDFTTVCSNSSVARMSEVGAHCYLNLSQQYAGRIAPCTFYSPAFPRPLRVLSG